MRKSLIPLAVCILIATAGYFIFSSTSPDGGADKTSKQAKMSGSDKDTLHETMNEMKQKAESYDENYESLAMSRAASELAEDMLGQADDKAKLETAAGVFAGYMVRNTMGLKAYCAGHGVDVSPFTNAFKAQHKDMAETAEKYYVIENQMQAIYDEMKDTLTKLIDQEMSDVAAMMGYKSNAQSCEWMNSSAEQVLEHAKFEKAVPAAYAVLAGAE